MTYKSLDWSFPICQYLKREFLNEHMHTCPGDSHVGLCRQTGRIGGQGGNETVEMLCNSELISLVVASEASTCTECWHMATGAHIGGSVAALWRVTSPGFPPFYSLDIFRVGNALREERLQSELRSASCIKNLHFRFQFLGHDFSDAPSTLFARLTRINTRKSDVRSSSLSLMLLSTGRSTVT